MDIYSISNLLEALAQQENKIGFVSPEKRNERNCSVNPVIVV